MSKFHWDDHIEERADLLGGKPVFKGTRIPVELILTELGNGLDQNELLANYPSLKRDHIRAAMLFAAAMLKMEA
ncbi:MAG: DUF433 domain-containing protein [Gemmataceae bacterium]|jgi:uncharacterized protein (DUF433 family)|nr:DUF433 domain-containing protein [Gemmataceae bacterium]